MSSPARRLSAARFLVVASLGLAACAGRPTGPAAGSVITGEQTTTLALGQTSTFGSSAALRITAVAVEADSRCPVAVQCVWSGDAAIQLRLELASMPAPMSTTLHTTLQPQQIVVSDQFALRLVSVTPQNHAGTPIPADAYRITIEVSAP